MTDRIEKTVELKAPVSRVWKALTDHEEFGTWFRVKLEAPLVPGRISTGYKTSPGLEHLKWEAMVQKIEPERLFSFTWHPFASEPDTDYSERTSNLVEFTLEKTPTGTRLRVVESGFDKLPPPRRDATFQRHGDGWGLQMQNIAQHLQQGGCP
jgi:uncharacterized protein YndB with AHSA1/START domain